MRELDRRVAPTFSAQQSLLTRRQALAAGGSEAAVHRRVRSGTWEVAERGVYALPGVAWTWRRNLAAVVLSVAHAVASHRAAAVLLGVRWDDRAVAPIELTVPARRRPRRDFERTRSRVPDLPVVVHEHLDHHRVPARLVDGIPCTTPLRLAVDLGDVVHFDRYRRSIGAIRRHHGVEWVDLERTYRRHSIQGRNGCGALRDLLDLHFGERGAPDEVVEIRCADVLRSAGLPTPEHQWEVVRPDGRHAFFDLAYPALRIGIETDGRIHADDDVRLADLHRQNNLALLGWTILRFTWEDVHTRPGYVVATVRDAIAAATSR